MTGILISPKKNFTNVPSHGVQVIPGGFVISDDRLNPEFLFLGLTTIEFADIENLARHAKDSWEFKSLRSLDPSQVYRELLKFADNQESKLNPHAIVSMIATINTLAIIRESKQLVQKTCKSQQIDNRKFENAI